MENIIEIIRKLKRICIKDTSSPLFSQNDYIRLYVDFNGEIEFSLKCHDAEIPLSTFQKVADFISTFEVDCKISYEVLFGRIVFKFYGV